MKKFLIHIILTALLFQSTSNFWVVVAFYINQDYISQNICINRFDQIPVCKGQCFLKEKLEESQTKEQKIPNLKSKEIQLFYTITEYTNDNVIVLFQERSKPVILPDFTISTKISSSIFHPPKQC